MKILFIILSFVYCLKAFSAPTQTPSSSKKKVYSFEPLLIRGKREFIKTSQDMKAEGEDIVSSELFSIKIDTRRRIFEELELE